VNPQLKLPGNQRRVDNRADPPFGAVSLRSFDELELPQKDFSVLNL
jgi:hypothetical protein